MKKILFFIICIPLFLIGCKTKNDLKLPIIINESVMDFGVGKIAQDGEDYLVVLTRGDTKDYGKDIVIYHIESAKEICRKDYTDLKPWKITIGDVDGDKIDDISIGVYKKSPLHDIMAKRPFIYNFEDGQIVPKWRGSRLSRPFEDYVLYDIDGDNMAEIVAVEILEDNKKILHSYSWKGFGFEGDSESEIYENIEDIFIEDQHLYINMVEGKKEYTAKLMLKDNKLILERID